MIRRVYVFFLLFLVVAVGHGQPPLRRESLEAQRMADAAKQWGGLAERVVSRLATSSGPRSPSANRFYVQNLAPDMPFSRSFSRYLQQALLDKCYTVAKSPYNATVLNFRVERILYDQLKNAEVVITAFTESNSSVLSMYTEEFFVNPGDLGLYRTDFSAGAARKTSNQFHRDLPARRFSVVR